MPIKRRPRNLPVSLEARMPIPTWLVRFAVPLALIAASVLGAGWKWDGAIPH
jgi:hypothetical protein